MKFQVPQFIEQETKIVGPFTLKQFLFVSGGVASVFFWYVTTSGFLFVACALLFGGFFLALAFLKIDGIPFLNYLAYMLSYVLSPKQYLFSSGDKKQSPLAQPNLQK